MKKITIAILALISNVVFAQDGVLDTSFGTNGAALVNLDNGATFEDYVQPDGKIIFIQGNKFYRLNANGQIDTTFGVNGSINITQPHTYYDSFTVANNQITLITKALYDIYTLGRYNFNGTVDSTLGVNGVGYMTLDLGDDIQGHVRSKTAPDGKLYIVGSSDTAYGTYDDYYVKKFNLDGTEDTTFNDFASNYGINIGQSNVGYYSDEYMYNINLRSNGEVIVSGLSGFHTTSANSTAYYRSSFAIATVADNTQPVTAEQNYICYGGAKTALATDQNDNIYLLGGQTYLNGTANPVNVIQKFNAAGQPANSFGNASVLTVSLTIDATTKADFRKILVQTDGKIILAGMTSKTNELSGYPALIVARYLSSGAIDTTFGTNGYVLYDIPHPNTPANFNQLTQLFASPNYDTIYVTGYNQQNAVVLKFGNISMTPLTLPEFNSVAPICAGQNLSALPTTSNNGVAGTWTPALNNMATTQYTFTPNPLEHAASATMTIVVNQPTATTQTETACESYTWTENGSVYTQSGVYTHVTTNAAGCQNTATLNLTINHDTTSTVTAVSCGSYVWAANGVTYTSSGTYSYVSQNGAGCTNTATLHLTINTSAAPVAASAQTFDTDNNILSNVVISPQNVVWYASSADAASGVNALAPSTVLSNGATYYAVNVSSQGCASAPLAVTITVVPVVLVTPVFTSVAPICAGDALAQLPVISNNGIQGTWTPAINNNATTYYTFTPNDPAHFSSANMTIVVNQPTSANVTQSACETYTWAANGTTYTASGTYTSVSTNPAGCALTTTLHLTINNPVMPVGAPQQTLDTDHDSIADIVISPSTVVWYASEANALAAVNPLAANTVLTNGSTYYAVNTTPQGCSSDPFAVTVTVTLGTGTMNGVNFRFYPNPTSGFIYVENSEAIDNITVYNTIGQKVLSKKVYATEAQIDASGLPSGTYFMEVQSGQLTKTVKVVKN